MAVPLPATRSMSMCDDYEGLRKNKSLRPLYVNRCIYAPRNAWRVNKLGAHRESGVSHPRRGDEEVRGFRSFALLSDGQTLWHPGRLAPRGYTFVLSA